MEQHNHFEDLIFKDEQLTAEEEAIIASHLIECASCRNLQEGWQSCRNALETAPEISPPIGFTARWQTFAKTKEQSIINKRQRNWIIGIGSVLLFLSILTTILIAIPKAALSIYFKMIDWIVFLAETSNKLEPFLEFIKTPVLVFGLASIFATVCYVLFGMLVAFKYNQVNRGTQNL